MSIQTEENKTVVRRWVREVFNEHRLDSVEHLKVPDYVDWNPYPGQDVALAGFKAVLASYLQSFPDFCYDVDEELAEGDIVVCIGKWSGTHSADYMGIPATGKEISARRIDIVRFAGDKMTERWGTGNELKMLRFLGVARDPRPAVEGTDAQSVLRRFVSEVLDGRHLASVDELVHADARSDASNTLVLVGLSAALDDLTFRVVSVEQTEARATATISCTGTRARGLWGAAEPAPVDVSIQISATVVDGLITDLDVEVPLPALAEQLGVDEGTLGRHPRPTTPTGTPGDARFVLRRFVGEVLNDRDLGQLADVMATSARDHLQESLTTMALLHAFPDYQFNIERVVIEGNRVTVLAAFAGTHTRELLNIAPTHKSVITRSISLFTVEDGAIQDAIYNFDLHTLLTQLGAFPELGVFTGA